MQVSEKADLYLPLRMCVLHEDTQVLPLQTTYQRSTKKVHWRTDPMQYWGEPLLQSPVAALAQPAARLPYFTREHPKITALQMQAGGKGGKGEQRKPEPPAPAPPPLRLAAGPRPREPGAAGEAAAGAHTGVPYRPGAPPGKEGRRKAREGRKPRGRHPGGQRAGRGQPPGRRSGHCGAARRRGGGDGRGERAGPQAPGGPGRRWASGAAVGGAAAAGQVTS